MSSLPAQSELNWLRKSSLVLNVTLFWNTAFRKFQERTFARIPFFGHEQEDGEFLNGIEVEQLQVVHAQLVLFAEDVFHQRADAGKVALLRLVVYRLVEVEELADNGLVAHMSGTVQKPSYFGTPCHVILAVVLPQGLGVPCDALSHIAAVNAGLVHNLVKRCAYSDECFFLFHVSNIGFSAADNPVGRRIKHGCKATA